MVVVVYNITVLSADWLNQIQIYFYVNECMHFAVDEHLDRQIISPMITSPDHLAHDTKLAITV